MVWKYCGKKRRGKEREESVDREIKNLKSVNNFKKNQLLMIKP